MKPDAKQLIAALEAEYEKDEGFLGLLRTGHFDSHARDRFLRLLASIDVGADVSIDRRIVALLWYVPLFMQWQKESIRQRLPNFTLNGNLAVFANRSSIVNSPPVLGSLIPCRGVMIQSSKQPVRACWRA